VKERERKREPRAREGELIRKRDLVAPAARV